MDAYIPDALTILGWACTAGVALWRVWLHTTQARAATERADKAEAALQREAGRREELRRQLKDLQAEIRERRQTVREVDDEGRLRALALDMTVGRTRAALDELEALDQR